MRYNNININLCSLSSWPFRWAVCSFPFHQFDLRAGCFYPPVQKTAVFSETLQASSPPPPLSNQNWFSLEWRMDTEQPCTAFELRENSGKGKIQKRRPNRGRSTYTPGSSSEWWGWEHWPVGIHCCRVWMRPAWMRSARGTSTQRLSHGPFTFPFFSTHSVRFPYGIFKPILLLFFLLSLLLAPMPFSPCIQTLVAFLPFSCHVYPFFPHPPSSSTPLIPVCAPLSNFIASTHSHTYKH